MKRLLDISFIHDPDIQVTDICLVNGKNWKEIGRGIDEEFLDEVTELIEMVQKRFGAVNILQIIRTLFKRKLIGEELGEYIIAAAMLFTGGVLDHRMACYEKIVKRKERMFSEDVENEVKNLMIQFTINKKDWNDLQNVDEVDIANAAGLFWYCSFAYVFQNYNECHQEYLRWIVKQMLKDLPKE